MKKIKNFVIDSNIKIKNLYPTIFLHSYHKTYKNEKILIGISEKNLEKDLIYLKKIKSHLLISISKFLNNYHQLNHSKRFWEIDIGAWLDSYIFLIYESWQTLSKLSNIDSKFLVNIKKYQDEDLVAETVDQYSNLVIKEEYVNNIYFMIIKYRFSNNLKFIIKEKKQAKNILKKIKSKFTITPSINLNNIVLKIYHFIFSYFIKKQKFAILRSYLGSADEIKLNLKLKQLPTFVPNLYSILKADFVLRKKISLNEKKNSELENFLFEKIFLFLPVSFLEGFRVVENKVNKLVLPLKPRKIFSSNIVSKTLLTRYCAHKVEIGAQLILGTHGGCYGHYRIHQSELHERKISDLYLTYGWKDKKDLKVKSIGMIRPLPKFNKNKIKSSLTMIVPASPIFENSIGMEALINRDKKLYFGPYCKIIDNLKKEILSNLLIRFYPRDFGIGEKNFFEYKYPNIKKDEQKISLFKTLSCTKIFLSPYIGTGFLETLALNIPTLVTNYDIINKTVNKNSIKYYEILKDANIYFEDANLLAQHVNLIWDNYQDWWNSKRVQRAVKIFCNQYAKVNPNKVNDLKKILIYKATK